MSRDNSKIIFYTTGDLFNPKDFRWYGSINNIFYREMMINHFENSELRIVKDCYEIGDVINQRMFSEERRLVQTKEEHNTRMQQFREYNSNHSFEHAFCPKPIRNFDEDSFEFKVGIDGIILPCHHAEYDDVYSMINNINGSFSERLKIKEEKFDKLYDLENNKYQKEFLMKQEMAGKYFYQRFGIPVFESFKFFSGYRFNNESIGEVESMEEKNEYVKFAFDKWLKKNFSSGKKD